MHIQIAANRVLYKLLIITLSMLAYSDCLSIPFMRLLVLACPCIFRLRQTEFSMDSLLFSSYILLSMLAHWAFVFKSCAPGSMHLFETEQMGPFDQKCCRLANWRKLRIWLTTVLGQISTAGDCFQLQQAFSFNTVWGLSLACKPLLQGSRRNIAKLQSDSSLNRTSEEQSSRQHMTCS